MIGRTGTCPSPPSPPPPPPPTYIETANIKWCSGGGDYAPGDVYGAGVDGTCPLLPAGWTMERAVAECEVTCDASAECVGFTLYYPRECCLRTISVASKPSGGTARCYEKAPTST